MIKVPRQARWLVAGLAGIFLLAACTGTSSHTPVAPTETDAGEAGRQPEPTALPTGPVETLTPADISEPGYDIVTLLPPDAIPAIDEPQFYDVLGAELEYQADEMVLGVELNGEARAYPIGVLAQHEIVNDTVGGQPIAVTY
jgi:hypothetical protein